MRLDLLATVLLGVFALVFAAYHSPVAIERGVWLRAAIAAGIGLAAAFVVLTLKVDLVPDDLEAPADWTLIVVITVVLVAASVYRSWRG